MSIVGEPKVYKMTILSNFDSQVENVEKLMNFDRELLSIVIQSVSDLRNRLRSHHKLDNPMLTADRTLEQLQGFQKNDSLRPRYETIFNQSLVLLVSYFSSSVQDLFKLALAAAIDGGADLNLMKEELKFSLRDLSERNFDLKDAIPDLLILAKDISFQDMQSISRAFNSHLGIIIEKDEAVNNIILAQGCRHVIVHVGGLVSERLLKQVALASPREVKPTLTLHCRVQFSEQEVILVAQNMKKYLTVVAQKVQQKYNIPI